jgi:hypothetical protein
MNLGQPVVFRDDVRIEGRVTALREGGARDVEVQVFPEGYPDGVVFRFSFVDDELAEALFKTKEVDG